MCWSSLPAFIPLSIGIQIIWRGYSALATRLLLGDAVASEDDQILRPAPISWPIADAEGRSGPPRNRRRSLRLRSERQRRRPAAAVYRSAYEGFLSADHPVSAAQRSRS